MADTTYGKFTPIHYDKVEGTKEGTFYYDMPDKQSLDVSTEGVPLGVNMYMDFQPNTRVVDAKKIGFVQTAGGSEDRNGKTKYMRGWRKRIMIKEGAGKGIFIDQLKHHKNPIYSTGQDIVEPTDKSRKGKKEQRNKLEGYKDQPVKDVSAVRQPGEVEQDYDDQIKKAPDKATEQSLKKLKKDALKESNKVTNEGKIQGRKYAGSGEFGWRYQSGNGLELKNATFQDTPHTDHVETRANQEFETTVLVVEGAQKGMYLGSVKWGWERKVDTASLDGKLTTLKTDAEEAIKKVNQSQPEEAIIKEENEISDKAIAKMQEEIKDAHVNSFSLTPFDVVSTGAPSETFFEAAEHWNKPRFPRTDKSTIDLPMSEAKVHTDKAPLFVKKEEIGTGTPIEIDDKTTCRFVESDTIGGTEYALVRCLDGKQKGTTGWIKMGDLTRT